MINNAYTSIYMYIFQKRIFMHIQIKIDLVSKQYISGNFLHQLIKYQNNFWKLTENKFGGIIEF